jgi:hypothetical protein
MLKVLESAKDAISMHYLCFIHALPMLYPCSTYALSTLYLPSTYALPFQLHLSYIKEPAWDAGRFSIRF